MTLKSIGIASDGLLPSSTKKSLLIATRGLIDAGLRAGILLEIPLIAIPDNALHDVNILDVIQFLVITDEQKEDLFALINDTVLNSVICNVPIVNRAMVNNDPNSQVTEIDL